MAYNWIRDKINNLVYEKGSYLNRDGEEGVAWIMDIAGTLKPVIKFDEVQASTDSYLELSRSLDDFEIWDSPDPMGTTLDCSVENLVIQPTFEAGDFTTSGGHMFIALSKADPLLSLEFCSKFTGGFDRDEFGNPYNLVFIPVSYIGGKYTVETDISTERTVEVVYVKQAGCENYFTMFFLNTWWNSGGGGGDPITGNDFADNGVETSNNIITWENRDEISIPSGISINGGHCLPVWSNEPLATDGKMSLFKKAFTHKPDLDAFPSSEFTPYMIANFEAAYGILAEAAQQMTNAGKNGGIYGDVYTLYTSGGMNYSGLTATGMIELGKYVYYRRSAIRDKDTLAYSISGVHQRLTLDEESMPATSGGNDIYTLLSFVNQGFYQATREIDPLSQAKLGLYSKPTSYSIQATNIAIDYSPVTDNWIQTELLNNGDNNLNKSGFKNYGMYTDIRQTGYQKVPHISSHNKYQKSGSDFVISGGKRVWNDSDFSETIFGQTTNFYGEPQGVIVTGDSNIDPRPIGEWQPETQLYVTGMHRYYTGCMWTYAKIRYAEFSDFNLSSYNPNKKLEAISIDRLRTEPFTAYGNAEEIRELGAEQIKACAMFALLSGADGIELWDDSRRYSATSSPPERGEDIMPLVDSGALVPQNFSRYSVFTDCVQTFAQLTADMNRLNWKFIHGYYPIVSGRDNEISWTGIYENDKAVMFFQYPDANFDETTSVTLFIGTDSFSISLDGDKIFVKKFTGLQLGLSTDQFRVEYSNIYGVSKKIKGRFTNIISDRYY